MPKFNISVDTDSKTVTIDKDGVKLDNLDAFYVNKYKECEYRTGGSFDCVSVSYTSKEDGMNVCRYNYFSTDPKVTAVLDQKVSTHISDSLGESAKSINETVKIIGSLGKK